MRPELLERSRREPASAAPLGCEWLVDAHGCDPARLRDIDSVRAVFEVAVRELQLHPAAEALWHRFPEPGGLTGLLLLQESHLACHTFPEHGFAAFDLYCCRPRPEWAWGARLGELLGATRVEVRPLQRGGR